LTLVASIGIPKLNGDASGQRQPMAVNSTGTAETPRSALRTESGSVAPSAPVRVECHKSRSTSARHAEPRHSECELQLD
jgi:hypothetical protein